MDWTFSIDNALTQYLAADQSIDVTYRITITDDSGVKNDPEAETETQDVVITINGANDDPVLSVSSLLNSDAESLTETDAALTTSGTLTATDIDLTNTVSISNISVSSGDTTDGLISNPTELLNMLSVSPVQVLDGTQTVNQFTWSFNSAPPANTNPESFDYLANGETLTLTYTLTLSDGESGTTPDTHNIVITINGTNDDPQITGVVTTGSLTEASTLSDSGSITFSDIDKSNRPSASKATHAITALRVDGSTSFNLTPEQHSALEAGFTISTVAGAVNTGTVNWDYSLLETQLDFLAEGEVVTAAFDIILTDDDSAVASERVTITITGANDAPTSTASSVPMPVLPEDSSAQATIANLFDGAGDNSTFLDNLDFSGAGDNLAGVVIVNNAANSSQGTWKYQLAGNPVFWDVSPTWKIR